MCKICLYRFETQPSVQVLQQPVMSGHSLITDLRQDKTEEGLQDKIYKDLTFLCCHSQIRFPQLYQHFFQSQDHRRI